MVELNGNTNSNVATTKQTTTQSPLESLVAQSKILATESKKLADEFASGKVKDLATFMVSYNQNKTSTESTQKAIDTLKLDIAKNGMRVTILKKHKVTKLFVDATDSKNIILRLNDESSFKRKGSSNSGKGLDWSDGKTTCKAKAIVDSMDDATKKEAIDSLGGTASASAWSRIVEASQKKGKLTQWHIVVKAK
jgi:hypothetical protein